MKKYMIYPYASSLAEHIVAYIAEKRSCGYLYNKEALLLYRFDRMICEHNLDSGEINQQMVNAWCQQLPSECQNTCKTRSLVLAGFVKYLNAIGIKAVMPKKIRHQPCPVHDIPTKEELKDFFDFLDHLVPPKLPVNFKSNDHYFIRNSVIYRLIYCTGMRLSEASNLRWQDLDFETGKLQILFSKGDKHRVIYLQNDMLALLKRYQQKLKELDYISDWLFPSKYRKEQSISAQFVTKTFTNLWSQFKGEQLCKQSRPTVHSLRHSFILTRLATWTEEGVDIKVMLPYLSAHLGHKSVAETYYYIQGLSHLVPAVKRFMETKDQLSEELYRYE